MSFYACAVVNLGGVSAKLSGPSPEWASLDQRLARKAFNPISLSTDHPVRAESLAIVFQTNTRRKWVFDSWGAGGLGFDPRSRLSRRHAAVFVRPSRPRTRPSHQLSIFVIVDSFSIIHFPCFHTTLCLGLRFV